MDGKQVRASSINASQYKCSADVALVPAMANSPYYRSAWALETLFGTYWKSRCLSIVMAVTTRGLRPVESACSSMLLEMSAVMNSVSAAVPAPQHLMDSLI
jgi:hypothetical protein